ncbi:MAG: hypothetical protein ABI621_11615 [Chloroflexota bacterium]
MLTLRTPKIYLSTFVLLLSSLACRAVTSLVIPNTPTPPPTPTSTFTPSPPPTLAVTTAVEVEQEAFCPVVLSDIMTAAGILGETGAADKERHLVTYTVTAEEISDPYYERVPANFKEEQEDTATHQQVWDYFTALIPAEQREFVAEYSIITDGKDNILAAVMQTADDPTSWTLEVDTADTSDYYNLTFTLIHEFGHLLTLNADQVPPSNEVFNHPDDNGIHLQETSLCPNYFPGEGCSQADSYINTFHQRFWTNIYDEWNRIDQIEDEDVYYGQLDEFYFRYRDQFVSDYAASHPAEDIAESWSHFVFGPRPQGMTIAEQKILFFYEYPELTALREEILGNLCTAFPQ